MQGSIKTEAGEKKLTDVTTSMKSESKYTKRTEILRAGEVDRGEGQRY